MDCHRCPKVFKTEDALADHFEKDYLKPVDDSFYDDDSWTITLIPGSTANTGKK